MPCKVAFKVNEATISRSIRERMFTSQRCSVRAYFALGLVFALVGCATPYQPQGYTGGFTELQLAENVWRVSFFGNAYTHSQRAENLSLLRCAEITLATGYEYFGLADSKSGNEYSTSTSPATSYTTGNAYFAGNYAYGSATTQTYGGQTTVIAKPSTTNTIVMFKQKPDNAGMVFDAKFICQSVGSRYGIVCGEKK